MPTTYTQDYAAPLPVVLQAKTSTTNTQYLYSNGTRPIGQYAGAWQYLLPDALGSVRQIADASGNVILTESYEPYGKLLNSTGTASSIFAYAGEQLDTTGLIYLRARYIQPRLGVFLSRDPWSGDVMRPGSMNGFGYVEGNPVNRVDPTGQVSEEEKEYIRYLYKSFIKDVTERLGDPVLTNLSNEAFASMIAAKFLVEDATYFADQQPDGSNRYLKDIAMQNLPDWAVDKLQGGGQEYSWGPANIPFSLAERYLKWWEQNHFNLPSYCATLEAVDTKYYAVRDSWLARLRNYGRSERQTVAKELVTDKGAVQGTALAILESSDRARKYWRSIGQPSHALPAYTIALGVNAYNERNETLYILNNWTSKGSAWDWVEAIPAAAQELGLTLGNFLSYTDQEKATLAPLPR